MTMLSPLSCRPLTQSVFRRQLTIVSANKGSKALAKIRSSVLISTSALKAQNVMKMRSVKIEWAILVVPVILAFREVECHV